MQSVKNSVESDVSSHAGMIIMIYPQSLSPCNDQRFSHFC